MAYDFKVSFMDMIGSMYDPLIVYPGGWEDTVPQWLRQQVELDRMIQVMEAAKQGKRPEEATNAEALAYLMTAINIAPFPHDWANIYLWLGHEVMKRSGREKEVVASTKELAPKELSSGEKDDLRRLKEWLWNKRIAGRKLPSEAPGLPAPIPSPAPQTAAPPPAAPRRKRKRRRATTAMAGVDAPAEVAVQLPSVFAIREGGLFSGCPHFEFETALAGGRMDDDPEDQQELDELVENSFADIADIRKGAVPETGLWTWWIIARAPEDLEGWRTAAAQRLVLVASE